MARSQRIDRCRRLFMRASALAALPLRQGRR
jgi:hypothetical protein